MLYFAFNPINSGEGGFLARTIRSLTITLKRLYLAPPNLVTFCFYLLDTFWQILAKSIHQGVAAVVFEMRRLKNLSIRIFLFRFKTMKMQRGRGYKFVPGKMFSSTKSEFCLIPGGKYRIAMTCSILEPKFL